MFDLIENAEKLSREGVYPFHMPGHKRNPLFMPADLLNLDVTEIPGMDNLHNPKEAIAAAQRYAAELWGAGYSFFLVNGSSCGIVAAVMSVCGDGDMLLAARNSHLSLYNALTLSGTRPFYVNPEILPNGLVGGVTPENVEAALKKYSKVKAVFITSPTYEGFISDIKRIAEIVHKYRKYLIVDEAHGAHFIFSQKLPETAVKLGADIVIQSLHKTLPMLGQSAILHVKSKYIDMFRLKQSLAITQTTSPSYMFMCVMQHSIKRLSKDKSLFLDYINRLENFRKEMQELCHMKLLGHELIGSYGIFDVDSGKLVFTTANERGDKVGEILRTRYKLEIEASGHNHIIAMTSVADIDEGFKRLKEAIFEIDKETTDAKANKPLRTFELPEMALTPREVWDKRKVKTELKDAIGKISGENITPYPPGIPILAVGEIITEEIVEYIIAEGVGIENIYTI